MAFLGQKYLINTYVGMVFDFMVNEGYLNRMQSYRSLKFVWTIHMRRSDRPEVWNSYIHIYNTMIALIYFMQQNKRPYIWFENIHMFGPF